MDGNRKFRSIQTTNILKICFLVNPNKAREIVKKIYKRDSEILKLSKELSLSMGRTDLEIINEIENVRSSNNINWMDLVRLAFEYAPEQAKAIMSKINSDDSKVTNLLEELSNNEK